MTSDNNGFEEPFNLKKTDEMLCFAAPTYRSSLRVLSYTLTSQHAVVIRGSGQSHLKTVVPDEVTPVAPQNASRG